jgi:beta-lactam-binding protein with PASTA domain
VFKQSFLFNVFFITLITLGLLYLFFNSLNWLTNHGKQTTVPALMGKNMREAVKELEKMGFRIDIDSTYKSNSAPLEVLFQEPEAGTSVKIGRTIFLTINKKIPPSIEMPNLVNMSFRNALLTMHSYYLEMGDTSYRPDVAAGAVLEQWVNGKQITPGTLIPFGTKINLVIGEGLSGEQPVPNLIGMTWADAKLLLDSLSLTSNVIWEGPLADSNTAIIYMQQPEALNELDFRNSIPEGDIIDIRIMQSPSEELIKQNQPGSKKLIGNDDSNGLVEPIINEPAAQPKKNISDSLRRKKIPGMDVHTLPTVETKQSKNTMKAPDKKSTSSDVINRDKDKLKPKPKTDAKTAPVKKNDANISNDYN